MSNNRFFRGLVICLIGVCSGTRADTFIPNDIFGLEYAGNPQISPDGKRVAYVSSEEGGVQIYLRWMDNGQVARLTGLTSDLGSLSWSPDGRLVAKVVNTLGWFEQHKN